MARSFCVLAALPCNCPCPGFSSVCVFLCAQCIKITHIRLRLRPRLRRLVPSSCPFAGLLQHATALLQHDNGEKSEYGGCVTSRHRRGRRGRCWMDSLSLSMTDFFHSSASEQMLCRIHTTAMRTRADIFVVAGAYV